MTPDKPTTLEMFSQAYLHTRVDDAYKVDPEAGCWIWQKRINAAGYGVARLKENGRAFFTAPHRVTWYLANGPIPEGHHIDHLCRNRACVNPAHLEAVTPLENVSRGLLPGMKGCRKHGFHDGIAIRNPYRKTERLKWSCYICARARSVHRVR